MPSLKKLGGTREQRSIRFGIICDDMQFPAWQAEAIRALIATTGVKAAVLIVRDELPRRRWTTHFSRGSQLMWNAFYNGYVLRKSRAMRRIDLTEELVDVPEIRCRVVRTSALSEAFRQEDLVAIRDFKLDFLLHFGGATIQGAVLNVPRFGVWSFHPVEPSLHSNPPCFWEMLDKQPVVTAVLQRVTSQSDQSNRSIVLQSGFFKTTLHSYVRTLDEVLLGSAEWVSVVCRGIIEGDIDSVQEPSNTEISVGGEVTNRVMLRFLIGQAAALVRSQWHGLTSAAHWTVGVVDAPIAAFLGDSTPEIRWASEPGRDRYLADPFALAHNGALVALVEDYDYRRSRGVISVMELDGDNPRLRKVIDTGLHASYPYLFQAKGATWCVPETHQHGEVRLYRAKHFPNEWELVTTILKGVAVLDPTIVAHDGHWWLFGTDHTSGPNTKLFIWHSEQLFGPWVAHRLNPVKTDIRSSRPAGTPFVVDGVLYRPAQDGSRGYGGSVVINRVNVLTPRHFAEEAVKTVLPPSRGPYKSGLHTLSAAGDQTLVDGMRQTFIPAAFRQELSARLAKLVLSKRR